MNISLAPEHVFTLFGLPLTNSMLAASVVTVVLLLVGLLIRLSLMKVPNRSQSFAELIYNGIFDLAVTIIGQEEVVRELFPYLVTLFLFIVLSSWVGLLPGVSSIGYHSIEHGKNIFIPLFRAPTTDLNMALVLALYSVVYVQYLGFKYAGLKGYLKKFFNFTNPIGFIVGILELVSEFTRIISYSFRLFGNIFAGEVLLAVMMFLTTSLVPYFPVLPILFFFLETGEAIIQGFVFFFLTILFASLAIVSHDEGGHNHGGEELLASQNAAEAEKEFSHPTLLIQPTKLTVKEFV